MKNNIKNTPDMSINNKIFYFIILAIFFLNTCTRDSEKTEQSKATNNLTYGIPLEPSSLDPAETGDFICWQIAFNIFETLVQYDWESGKFVPGLATSWEKSNDNLVWTFHLRAGVTFHDGAPLDAESVKNSFDRLVNKESIYYQNNLLTIYSDINLNMIDNIIIIDELIVRFYLKFTCSYFLDNIACPYFSSIVSTAALQQYGNQFGFNPVGTGPFKFNRWEKGKQIILEKFTDYWDGSAQIDGIIYKILPLLRDRIMLIKNNKLDIITGLSAAASNALYYLPNIKLITPRIAATVFLGFNCQRKPFDDVRFRKAILLALDIKTAVSSVSRGFADVAQNMLPPIVAGYDSAIQQESYDLEKAILLINQVKCSKDLKFKLGYFIETDTLRADPFAQYIKDQLQKIGLDIEIVTFNNWPRYYKEVFIDRQVDMLFDGWITYTRNADNFFQILFHSKSSYNFFNYHNPEVDQLLDEARQTMNERNRQQLYRKVHEIIISETPAVFISHPSMGYALRDKVKNFKPDPLMVVRLHQIELSDSKGEKGEYYHGFRSSHQ